MSPKEIDPDICIFGADSKFIVVLVSNRSRSAFIVDDLERPKIITHTLTKHYKITPFQVVHKIAHLERAKRKNTAFQWQFPHQLPVVAAGIQRPAPGDKHWETNTNRLKPAPGNQHRPPIAR